MSGMDLDSAYNVINSIRENISRVIVGKDFEVKIILATLFSEGHVLIEGPPGIAKTLLSKSIAKSIEGVFKRIQGNPDILPSDITGFHVYSLDGSTRFVKGPIFANIIFFDELNRTPTRSQAALLEAMQEYQVTVDGVTYRLDKPFMVIATQLPTELGPGTFPLTPTLVDRFTVRIETGYSSPNEEYEIVTKSDYLDVEYIEPVTNVDTVNRMISFIKEGIHVGERVAKYIVDLITYIRSRDDVVAGISHRASISLYRISRVLALMDKRDYVIPDDIKLLLEPTTAHRILLKPEADELSVKDVIQDALKNVKVPKE